MKQGVLLLLGVVTVALLVAGIQWKRTVGNCGTQPAVEPFRIAGNLYSVGASDVTAFLVTGPEGHVLIDGGFPSTAPMIMENIATLGFDIADVRVLLNSHAHCDHAGGLAELQDASGAELWVSERDADIMAAGGAGDPTVGNFTGGWIFKLLRVYRFRAPRIDHRFTDGATISLGPLELTAHITAGHTPGCTSWSFPVRDGDREWQVVNVCSATSLQGASLVEPEAYPGIRADFEDTFRTLRSLPIDIFLASHGQFFSMGRKLRERAAADAAADPVEPFVDPEGYLEFVAAKEKQFREALAAQQDRQ